MSPPQRASKSQRESAKAPGPCTAPARDSIHITATQRQGAYADIVAFAHALAATHGSAVNAIACAVRESEAFRKWSADHRPPRP